jgi:hypothetical protein
LTDNNNIDIDLPAVIPGKKAQKKGQTTSKFLSFEAGDPLCHTLGCICSHITTLGNNNASSSTPQVKKPVEKVAAKYPELVRKASNFPDKQALFTKVVDEENWY